MRTPEEEHWMPVQLDNREYPYDISDHGRVRNRGGKVLKPWKRGQRKGIYFCVELWRNGTKKKIDLHRLVALHFLPNPSGYPEVNHFNCNPFDNRASNLEWCTRRQNERHKQFMKSFEATGTSATPFSEIR